MIENIKILWLKFGFLKVESYRVLAYLGFLVGLFLSLKEAKRRKFDENHIYLSSVFIIIGVLVGARLFFYLGPWTWHRNFSLGFRLTHVWYFWGSGLVMYGGFVGAIAAVFLYSRYKKIDAWEFLDLYAPAFCIGLMIYRLGCFLSGDHKGIITDLPWGITQWSGIRHPVSMYHSISGLILFFILNKIKFRKMFNGYTTLWGMVIYSIMRFVIEFFRDDPRYFGLTVSAYFSVIVLLFAVFMLRKKYLSFNLSEKS